MVSPVDISRALRSALPDVKRPLKLAGLDAPVTVYRDAWGIPHIQARTAHDAWFGQGFVAAQERMFQMDYDRRRAAGRWAEAIGPAALAADKQARRFQIVQAAEAQFAGLKPGTRGMLDAYASGVNAFLDECWRAGKLPAFEFALTGTEVEPWRAVDSLAVFLVRHILMGGWESKVWRARLLSQVGPATMAALHPGYEPGQLVIVPPDATYDGPTLDALETLAEGIAHLTHLKEWIDQGSNNWVVGGARTRSGKPLVAGDPHRTLDVPNVYYQNHVACPEWDVVGFSFAGIPGFPHFAHNARVAWAITHAEADYQDLYIERFNPAHPHQYEVDSAWREAQVTRSPVHVKGGETVMVEVARTRHGPIVAGDPKRGTALALAYTGTLPDNRTFDAIHDMLYARDADALEAAMRPWCDPVNNLVYADVDGAIGYRTRGRMPLRNEANAWLPVPGWTQAYEWTREIPFEEMPAVRDPTTGYAYTANNRIPPTDYPYSLGHDYLPGFRAQRIRDQLAEGRDLTVADMARIHADVLSLPALAWRALWPRVKPAGEAERRALDMLRAWDGRMTRDSAVAPLYATFRAEVLGRALSSVLGPVATPLFKATDRGANGFLRDVLSRLHHEIRDNAPTLLPPGTTWDSVMAEALTSAVGKLEQRLGPDPTRWRWDAVHTTAARHPLSAAIEKEYPGLSKHLDPAPIPMGGDGDTVQAAGFYPMQTLTVHLISMARYVFDFGDWERSTWVVPGGVSGHPASPHYQDQVPLYREHQTVPMLYGWKRIAKEAKALQRLAPAPSGTKRR